MTGQVSIPLNVRGTFRCDKRSQTSVLRERRNLKKLWFADSLRRAREIGQDLGQVRSLDSGCQMLDR